MVVSATGEQKQQQQEVFMQDSTSFYSIWRIWLIPGALYSPLVIKMKNHTSLLLSILHVSTSQPPSITQPPFTSLTCKSTHICAQWWNVSFYIRTDCAFRLLKRMPTQLSHCLLMWAVDCLLCVNPDLLFDDMNLNNEGTCQTKPERKFMVLAAPTV